MLIRSVIAAIVGSFLLFSGSSAFAQRHSAPAPGTVLMRVFGPDGKPLANTKVIIGTLGHVWPGDPLPSAEPTTDGAGWAKFDWFSGEDRLLATAPGVGYAPTGSLNITAGKVNKVPLPPLAPFSRISGQVAANLLGQVTDVEFRRFPETIVKVPLDANGRFTARLPAGEWWVRGRKNGKITASLHWQLEVGPGQQISGITLEKPRQVAATAPFALFGAGGGRMNEKPIITWVTGVVRDEHGAPIQGATVYASGTYFGAIRMYEVAGSGVTDAAGRYAIRGEGDLQGFSATLVATKPGMAYEMAWISGPQPQLGAGGPAGKAAVTPSRDFVLSTHGGQLEIAAEMDGKPQQAVNVRLQRVGGELRQIWAAPTGGEAQRAVESLVFPVHATGADGIARFSDLPPGLYFVSCNTGGVRRTSFPQLETSGSNSPSADAVAVPVRSGQTTRFRMVVYPQFNRVELRVIRTDGQPLDRKNVTFGFSSANSSSGSTTFVKVDQGLTQLHFEPAGLWRVALKYLSDNTNRMVEAPCFEASAVVAASPLLQPAQPIDIKARWVKLASVSVQLLDAAGKPAPGVVELGQLPNEGDTIASTDPEGQVQFDGVKTWQYYLFANLRGQRQVNLGTGWNNAPLPSDDSLRGLTFVPPGKVTAVPDEHSHVVLRACPAGFVRAFLRPPPGSSVKDFRLDTIVGPDDRSQMEYLPRTGELLGGPFQAGKIELRVYRQRDFGQGKPCAVQEVEVKAGDVVHVDVRPPPDAGPNPGRLGATGNAMIGMGTGVELQGEGADEMTGKVYLPGGRAPAYGAMLLYYPAGQQQATVAGVTDALGQIHARGLWITQEPSAATQAGSPAGPVVIAFLPGSNGAVVVTPVAGKSLSITLAKSVLARGTITLGGASIAGRIGEFRVLALYQNKGKLNDALSVWATPRADGTFELPGLTPGTYQVQASLDGIWLSKSLTLDVADSDPAPLTLDIGEPGGAVAVYLKDTAGKPLIGHAISVDRPTGPLADFYWPRQFLSDGAGTAYIPAIEVARHTIHVEGSSAVSQVTVPAIAEAKVTQVTIELPKDFR